MKYFAWGLVALICSGGCAKNNTRRYSDQKVAIYLLRSFTVLVDTTRNPYPQSITDAVMEETPLLSDDEILYYEASRSTFTLSRDIRQLIYHFNGQKGFAVTINGEPVYYGKFHPLYYSSIAFGVATIDPMSLENRLLPIRFARFSDTDLLNQLDKRNDSRLIAAFAESGRLR